jgi:large subunit ribosomal protein L24
MILEKNRVTVEGVNMMKKHEKKTQDNPQGAIVEREASIHFSNVKRADS